MAVRAHAIADRVPAVAVRPEALVRNAVPATDAMALVGALAAVSPTIPSRLTALTFALSAVLLLLPTQRLARVACRVADDVQPVLLRLSAATVAAGVAAKLTGADTGAVVPLFVAASVAVLTGRWLAYNFTRRCRATGIVTESTLVVGDGPRSHRIAELLSEHPESGLVPVGVVSEWRDDDELDGALSAALEGDGVARVIAVVDRSDPGLVRALRRLQASHVHVDVVPPLAETELVAADADELWGTTLVPLRTHATRQPGWPLKRLFDVVASGVAIVVLSPLLAAIALAVKVSSRGPVLFRQTRVGRDGEPFELLKFRSMRIDACSHRTWNVRGSDGVTPVGRIIRATSLDELPQLFNVLRGEMTLVGPRPERPAFVDRFSREHPGYDDRHRMAPGMTGWAQIHGLRGDTSIGDRARFDNRYIDGWTLLRDTAILARTGSAVLRFAVEDLRARAPRRREAHAHVVPEPDEPVLVGSGEAEAS